jgi:hypothetical protein
VLREDRGKLGELLDGYLERGWPAVAAPICSVPPHNLGCLDFGFASCRV